MEGMIFNMKYGYIYRIDINNNESIFNGCYYYGQSKYDDRYGNGYDKHPLHVYFGSGRYIKQYIKKHGTKGLKKTLCCECNTLDELNKAENEYINDLYLNDAFKNGGKCLNLRAGGDMHGFSKETREKMSASMKGRKVSNETKMKISKSLSGNRNPMFGKKFLDYMSEDKISKYKENMKNILSKKKWWTNGSENIFSEKQPNGFTPGRTRIGKLGNNQYKKN